MTGGVVGPISGMPPRMPTSELNWVCSGVAVPWMTGPMMSVTTERGSRTPEQAWTTGGFDCA